MTAAQEIPAATYRDTFEIMRSRFISTVTHADTVEAARAFIAAIQREMPDANHYVYAFRIGHVPTVQEGMSDAGEPSGTAGPPTLAVLRGSGFGDVVLVTARYFGGTKLGTGGLVRAYTDAAKRVLAGVERKQKVALAVFRVELAYTHFESARRHLEALAAQVTHEVFAEQVTWVVALPAAQADALVAALTTLTAGRALIQRQG